jgi:ABC-type Mn2+/Zn2+ transport system ATPase subunit
MAGDVPLLEVADLDAYYGNTHVLQRVAFTVDAEPTAVIGRNGMDKTMLCKAIMASSHRAHAARSASTVASYLVRRRTGSADQGSRTCHKGVGSSPRFRRTSTRG